MSGLLGGRIAFALGYRSDSQVVSLALDNGDDTIVFMRTGLFLSWEDGSRFARIARCGAHHGAEAGILAYPQGPPFAERLHRSWILLSDDGVHESPGSGNASFEAARP